MCQFHTLSYDDHNGYVIHCKDCNNIQVAFGCVLINLDRRELKDFTAMVAHMVSEICPEMPPAIKSITIPTPCDGLMLYLSMRELLGLQKMLDESNTELCAHDMLELFNS